MSVHKAKALAELELAFCGSDSELEGKCIAGAIFKVFNALSLPSERRQKLLMEVVSHLNEEAIRCGELVSICPMEDASKSRDSFVVECLDDSFLQTEPNQRVKDTSNLVPIICGHSNSDSSERLFQVFEPFFGHEVPVFERLGDPSHEKLYQSSLVATKLGVPSNRIGMLLNRRKGNLPGVYQASKIVKKPNRKLSGSIRQGGYFISIPVCLMIERHFRRYSSFSHPEPSPEIFDASINESSSLIPPSSIESTNGCIEEGHFLARDSVSVASTNFKAESIPCGGSGRKVRPTAVNYQIVNPPAISALQASPIADELVSRGSSNSFNNIYQLYQHPQHLRNLRSL